MSQPRIYTNNKDMKKIIKSATQQGWLVEIAGKHIRWMSPDGKTLLYSPKTGSYRSWANFMARLKRAGWKDQ